jgi:hypothetical protein
MWPVIALTLYRGCDHRIQIKQLAARRKDKVG